MSNALRVVHVVSQLATGGMERLLVDFARHADRGAVDLHFVTLHGRGRFADDIEDCGWPVTALGLSPGLRPASVVRLARLIHRLGADVVHTHNTRPLLYAAPAARLARAGAVVHTRHGQRFGASSRENTMFRLASRLTDRVVSVSHDGTRLCLQEGVAAARVATIWNGVDLERFPYAGPRPDGPAVMVGRLCPEKDVETLLRAAALAVRTRPSFRLEIAGDGECMADLRRLAGERKLADNVRFLGEVRDVAALLARASVFVLPSLTEGVSLTLLEAMGRGLPVVATNVGGNPEVVEAGRTGLLVPPRSPDALASGLLALLNDAAAARRMGLAGRRRVQECFDVRRMVAEYEALYAEVCALRRRSRCPSRGREGTVAARRTVGGTI